MKNEQLKLEEYVKQRPIKIIRDYLESMTPTIDTSPERIDYIKNRLIDIVYAAVEDCKNKDGNKIIPTSTLAEELKGFAKGVRYCDKDIADALMTLNWTLKRYARLEKELGA